MTAVAHARPTICPFAIANGMLDIGRRPRSGCSLTAPVPPTARSRAATPASSMAASATSSLPWGTSDRSSARRTARSPSRTAWASRVLRPATLWRSFRPAPAG